MSTGTFEIRLRGRIGDSLLATFGEFAAEIKPAETVLRGSHLDQAALHGALERVRELGLELVEVRQVDERPETVTSARTP